MSAKNYGTTSKPNNGLSLGSEQKESSPTYPTMLLYDVLLEEYKQLGILRSDERSVIETLRDELIDKKIDPESKEFSAAMLLEIRRQLGFATGPPTEELEGVSGVETNEDSKEVPSSAAALCFSGGGIRSATIGLGILQALAKHRLLEKFTYLSSVSGGGYIAGWLSAWISRAGGIGKVQSALSGENHHSGANIEPPEVTHLRSFSNFMSPNMGLFSLDTWTLISVYLRNLMLNWLVFVPIIATLLLIPVLLLSIYHLKYEGLLLPPPINDQFVLLGLALLAGITGVCNIIAMRPTLGKFSWVTQEYKENEFGQIESTDKVRLWAFLPLTLLALFVSLYWHWAGRTGTADLARPFLQSVVPTSFLPDNLLFVSFILFGIAVFVGGFLVSHTFFIIGLRRIPKNNDSEGWKWINVAKEFVNSLVCGAFGGAALYFASIAVTSATDRLGKVFEGYPDLPFEAVTFYVSISVPVFMVVFGIAGALFVGIASKINDDMDREWMARFGALVFMFIAVWLVVCSIVFSGPVFMGWLLRGKNYAYYATPLFASLGGISGLITLILGFGQRTDGSPAGTEKSSFSSVILRLAPLVAAPIFIIFLMILVVSGTSGLIEFVGSKVDLLKIQSTGRDFPSTFQNLYIHFIWITVLATVGVVMGRWININKFSLHALYRERLIRAYLGASRSEDRLKTANGFTGLDSKDNIQMKDLIKERPFHVVNMALNLGKADNLRWQNRKAESFTASALHCGSSMMGDGSGRYRSSEKYGYNSQNDRAITLGTAGAISGAAASPNMGYYTMSSAVTILMTLFNIRLGWWMGNPGKAGDDTFDLASPLWSTRLFQTEAMGGTTDTKPYIYLSDGGHFENLGIYEMVLRRTRFILALDAGADPEFSFSDLGNAIHKIRVDMGIPIEFHGNPEKGRYCTIADIRYSAVDGCDKDKDGLLVYIKPTLDETEPIDIKHYSIKHNAFPHETTVDQFYSESQFESYRSLGFHMMETILHGGKKSDDSHINNFYDLKCEAEKYVKRTNERNKTRRKPQK